MLVTLALPKKECFAAMTESSFLKLKEPRFTKKQKACPSVQWILSVIYGKRQNLNFFMRFLKMTE